MSVDFGDVQFLVGKKLTQTIEANLRRKYGRIRVLVVGEPVPATRSEKVDVLVDSKGKITGFAETSA